MPVNHAVFERISQYRIPNFRCPHCKNETMQLVSNDAKDGPLWFENETTLLGHGFKAYDEINDSTFTFQGWAQCLDPRCRFLSSVHGESFTDFYYDEDNQPATLQILSIKGFSSPPLQINRPTDTPKEIESALQAAEALVWVDCSAAANKLRVLLETLLDLKGVQRSKKKKSGGLHQLNLGERTKLLPGKHANLIPLIDASRWLGNAGSHQSLSLSDVLDAFDIVEVILAGSFDKHSEDLHRKVTAINKGKGPIKK